MINYKSLLCSVGIMVEQSYLQMVTSWRSIYLVLVEMAMFAIKGFGGSLSSNVILAFPTDQFYSLVCAAKDVYAGAVGVGMGIMEAAHNLAVTGRIDLAAQSSSVAQQQDSLVAIQIRSLGSLVFNLIADSTLYPLLALHRWLLCVVGASSVQTDNVVTVHFGDIAMDSSWGTCSPLANDLSVILDPSQMQYAVQDSVESFVAYSMALLSGIGDTVLYALLLMYDSLIALLLSVVWGIQNIMYAFNPASCTVSDYMQKLVLKCACGDAPYSIPQPQRAHKWLDGALWCTGALSVRLLDGTQGIIYNPYSLDELSAGESFVSKHPDRQVIGHLHNQRPPIHDMMIILVHKGVVSTPDGKLQDSPRFQGSTDPHNAVTRQPVRQPIVLNASLLCLRESCLKHWDLIYEKQLECVA
jgi:hypothetical protein